MARGLQESLVRDLENLYDDHSTADLEFVAGALSDGGGQGGKLERIRAHRLIILFRCRRYWSKKQQWLTANLPMVTVRLEWTAPDTAKRVVRYLYTGQARALRLQLAANVRKRVREGCLVIIDCGPTVGSLLQTIVASLEFGLPELKVFCVEKLTNEITADTICTTLINLRSCLGSVPDANSLVEEVQCGCFDFIESNTRAVFKSKGFLQLSKENLLAIIQSSKLTASEEDVWRAVLSWGQANAGVQSSVKQWSEADRAKMKQVLNGVLEHVRLMEIGSDVFAQEVEPTGLLSMEMTLARYRHAAVHGKGLSPSDASRPRSGCPESFLGSEILVERGDCQIQINEWCDTPSQEWVLLYRASRDGYEARKFHAACDEKGATVVVVKTPSGCIFGGYTDISWSSRFKRGKFASSTTSFIFTLVNPSGGKPTKFEIKQPAYAINNHPGNGPIFGSGADLCISNECNRNKDSYSQLPYTYGDMDTPNYLLTGEQYFSVEDYEVFGLAR